MAIKKIKNIFNLLCTPTTEKIETRQKYFDCSIEQFRKKIVRGRFFLLKLMIVQSTTKLFTLSTVRIVGIQLVVGKIGD